MIYTLTIETRKQINQEVAGMEEKRLYNLAHDALLMMWGREHDFLEKHPEDEISINRERKLWNELEELEKEMKEKKF